MGDKRLPIIWKHRLVGYMDDWASDMLAWWGRWVPLADPSTDAFLEAVQSGNEVWVFLDDNDTPTSATVESLEDEQIEVKVRPRSA